jgi:hypothetical protein
LSPNLRRTAIALALAGAMNGLPALGATSATAQIGASVISNGQVSADASTQLLKSASIGVLILSIPGAGGGAPTVMTLTSSGGVSAGGASVFTSSDGTSLATLISQMAATGGTLTTSGTLSGVGVQIVVFKTAVSGDGGGSVTAIVTYN